MTRLFALMTARCEDGAEIAAAGQRRHLDGVRYRELAESLRSIGEEMVTLARAASALAGEPETGDRT